MCVCVCVTYVPKLGSSWPESQLSIPSVAVSPTRHEDSKEVAEHLMPLSRAGIPLPALPSATTVSPDKESDSSSVSLSFQTGKSVARSAARAVVNGRLAHQTCRRFGGGCWPADTSRRDSAPTVEAGSHCVIRGFGVMVQATSSRQAGRPCPWHGHTSTWLPRGTCRQCPEPPGKPFRILSGVQRP